MTISIIICPSCSTVLMNDSVQCHVCKHILNPELAESIPSNTLVSDTAVKNDQSVCRHCGETYRKGSVRCWSCNNFTREEIAQAYEQMLSKADRPVVGDGDQLPFALPELPAGAAAAAAAEGDYMAGDDDFELSDDVHLADGSSWEMPAAPDFDQAQPEAAAPAEDASTQKDPPQAEQVELPPVADENPDAPAAAEDANAADGNDAAKAEEPEQGAAHSVATGGEALLRIAMEEEKESGGRGKRRQPKIRPGMVLVYCPTGHRIIVEERHRGKPGRCPKCKSVFFVPLPPTKAPEPAAAANPASTGESADGEAGQFDVWMVDQHRHTVLPEKLKLKVGSLKNEFQTVDLVASDEQLLALKYEIKGGMFGKGDKLKEAARESAKAHLAAGNDPSEIPGSETTAYGPDELGAIRLVQPARPHDESVFAGIAVFGSGRIGLRLPKVGESAEPSFNCLSMALGEFRQFASAVRRITSDSDWGSDFGVPLEDEFEQMVCHYTDDVMHVLQHLEFYQEDPAFKLELLGWQCEGCGLIVSENARKKEKIGGKNPKSVSKAKCPKCKKKFGDQPLYGLESPQNPPGPSGEANP